jgi:hypothetical protein
MITHLSEVSCVLGRVTMLMSRAAAVRVQVVLGGAMKVAWHRRHSDLHRHCHGRDDQQGQCSWAESRGCEDLHGVYNQRKSDIRRLGSVS